MASNTDDGFITADLTQSTSGTNHDDGVLTANLNNNFGAPLNQDALPAYEVPSFKKARNYYDSTLPKRMYDKSQPKEYRLALAGELRSPTTNEAAVPYRFFSDPSFALDEFGIGISLYFKELKVIGVVMMICALISLVAFYQNALFTPTQTYINNYLDTHVNVTVQPSNIVSLYSYEQLTGSTYGAQRSGLYSRQIVLRYMF